MHANAWILDSSMCPVCITVSILLCEHPVNVNPMHSPCYRWRVWMGLKFQTLHFFAHKFFSAEPTSGLDSFTAHEVMSVVKTLVSEGITIVATIHCPPPHTFRLFDRVLMLQHGSLVYFGLNGTHSTRYFHDHFEDVRLRPFNFTTRIAACWCVSWIDYRGFRATMKYLVPLAWLALQGVGLQVCTECLIMHHHFENLKHHQA